MFDIIFISYNETNADDNYQKLKIRFPLAKRVRDVKGIHQAHIAAAKKSMTDMFWVVDADAIIFDYFDFTFNPAYRDLDRECVYVYRSQNPINDLVYGYGGVKLLPKKRTLDLDINKPDMTTSIGKELVSLPEISNLTAFNTDEFSSWKSAFRECSKLASGTISYRNKDIDEYRLDRWCSDYGKDKPYGEWAIQGAKAGRNYGLENKNDLDALKKINDFDWLRDEFSRNSV
jgi:hypothetical protein